MYDAIVVGARCAGSPTAMLLARKGYRVLLVDKATFPSDTLSTHIMWPQGAEALGRWGLLDRVIATGCPPIARDMTWDVDGLVLRGGVVVGTEPKTGYAPRRKLMDKILVDAAVESGAELREAFTVDDLLWNGERVSGIRGHSRNGNPVEEQARIVIGADGVNSFVARAVNADEYDTRGTLVCYYFSYFSRFEAPDLESYIRVPAFITIVPTNDNLTVVAGAWKSERFHEVRADIEGSMLTLMDSVPEVKDRYRAAEREEVWYGTAGVPNYMRKPYGLGWALVGDAGYDRDPNVAQGISDAFLDAENLSQAIDEGLAGRRPLADALADYESRRNERARMMFEFSCQLGTLEPLPSPLQQLIRALQGNRPMSDFYAAVITGYVPFSEFMNPDNIARVMAQGTPI